MYDIASKDEVAPTKTYNYDILPKQFDISKPKLTNVYDQFMQLRDTLVYSKKTFSWKAGSVLVIGDTEETVEVIIRNRFLQKLNPNREHDSNDIQTILQWPYVTTYDIDTITYGPAVCKVTKAWYYRITHKTEIENLPAGTTRIRVYVERLKMNAQWWYGQPGSGTPLALYDDESNTIPLDELYSSKTTIGTVDANLEEWDLLRFVAEDQNGNSLPLRQYRSNRWTVDYINLPLNE